jgi:hypothetical protein
MCLKCVKGVKGRTEKIKMAKGMYIGVTASHNESPN